MPIASDVAICAWLPPGVSRIINHGSENFVGLVDEYTVCRYPQIPSESTPHVKGPSRLLLALREHALTGLHIEECFYTVLGNHPRLVEFKGRNDYGLLFQNMVNGPVVDHYCPGVPLPPLELRIQWAMQIAEAVAYIHSKRVIHCNICPKVLLLDENLNLKLSDFQGKYLDNNGIIQLDGGAIEHIRCSMPRKNTRVTNELTDIFALGSTIYFLCNGCLPFPEIPEGRDEEIRNRFEDGPLPFLSHEGLTSVVFKCWTRQYLCAADVAVEMRQIADAYIPQGSAMI